MDIINRIKNVKGTKKTDVISEPLFENEDELINSNDYKSISDLESKIIEIINNRNCKYTINKI